MLKLIIVGRRRAGATRAQALRHLMHVHGRMVIDPPPEAGAMPADYTQNHVFDGAYPAGADAAHALERDLVTELWFETPQALGASTSTPYYLERLQPDEGNFVDRATVAAALYEATPRHTLEAGPFKLFAFLKTHGHIPADALSKATEAACESLVGEGGVQDLVRNTPLARPGAEPFASAVLELWFADAQSAIAFSQHQLPAIKARLGENVLDAAACLYLLAEEFSTPRLRAVHRDAE